MEADCSRRVRGRLRLADIRLVVGTRPEAIKLLPVADALAERRLAPTLILTGQQALEAADFVEEVRRIVGDPLVLAAMSRRAFPFGDGRSAPRVAAVIEEWLERKACGRLAAGGGHPG